MPAIRAMLERGDTSWASAPMTPWMGAALLLALDENQTRLALNSLVPHPRLEYSSEYIVAALAKRWPSLVLEFFSSRLIFKRTDEAPSSYEAIPYQVYELKEPLQRIPSDLAASARGWYHDLPYLFQYEGGRLLSCVFPELSDGLSAELETYINEDPSFVIAVLRAYEGKPVIYGIVRRIVANAEPELEVWRDAHTALDESGVVMGEYGFADLFASRRELLSEWLEDENEQVRVFATEHLNYLKNRELAETKRAEAGIAARKLEFDEDLAVEAEQAADTADERAGE